MLTVCLNKLNLCTSCARGHTATKPDIKDLLTQQLCHIGYIIFISHTCVINCTVSQCKFFVVSGYLYDSMLCCLVSCRKYKIRPIYEWIINGHTGCDYSIELGVRRQYHEYQLYRKNISTVQHCTVMRFTCIQHTHKHQ